MAQVPVYLQLHDETGFQYVFSAIGRLVVKIFAGCYFPLASGKMTR
jgi:hypothetical protein